MKKFLFFLFAIVNINAYARDKGDGCGLGWEVVSGRTMIATTTRGSTNSLVPPTFGMTTGTIGCDRHPIVKKDLPAVRFLATNFDVLKQEAAQGSGENLASLSQLIGCKNTIHLSRLAQKNYSSIFAKDEPLNAFNKIKEIAGQNCGTI